MTSRLELICASVPVSSIFTLQIVWCIHLWLLRLKKSIFMDRFLNVSPFYLEIRRKMGIFNSSRQIHPSLEEEEDGERRTGRLPEQSRAESSRRYWRQWWCRSRRSAGGSIHPSLQMICQGIYFVPPKPHPTPWHRFKKEEEEEEEEEEETEQNGFSSFGCSVCALCYFICHRLTDFFNLSLSL